MSFYLSVFVLACFCGVISAQVVGGARRVNTGVVGTGSVGVNTGVAGTGVGVGGIGTVIYDLNTQAKCTEVERQATQDCRWAAGLGMADQLIENGRIAAYKIMLDNNVYSEWYIPGLNDIDTYFNDSVRKCTLPIRRNTMRRMWSRFVDRPHRYIICKPHSGTGGVQ